MALQSLYQFLHHRQKPAVRQPVVPYLVMRSNLDMILERLRVDRGVGGTSEAERPARQGRPRRPRSA